MKKRINQSRTAGSAHVLGRCPACNMAKLDTDGDGVYCPNCLYTSSPPITLEAAVAKAEAIAVAESRALREELQRDHAPTHRRRAA